MPTIDGSKSGTRPYLQLDWSVLSQDTANNRSRVNLKLYLKVDYSIGYSARYTGTLYGASFTSSSGYISSPGRYKLTERTVWVNHNSDGTKTQSITADYNLNISWGGTYHGKITLSGSMALTAIPRASDFTAFGLSSTTLSGGTANHVTYKVNIKSNNFSNHYTLKYGSYTVKTWTGTANEGSVELTSSEVNSIITRTPNGTSGTLTLIMQTKSGSSNVGSSISRTRTFSLNSNIKPTASSLSVSISGTGRDNSIGKYVQGVSRVYVSFSSSGTYSSTIKSNKVTISRSGQTMTVSGRSGTSAVLTQYGDYNITAETTDSRGRKGTASAKITVDAYRAPSISGFSANRRTSPSSTVDIARVGSWSNLGGNNNLTYTLRRTGTTTPLQSGTWTGGSFNNTFASTGNSDTASYEFTLTIKDTFGREATSASRVGTAFQELTIAKGQGVGIGKIHENGVLDVDGAIYSNGARLDRAQLFDETGYSGTDTPSEWGKISQGVYYVRPRNIENQPTGYGFMDVMGIDFADEYNIIWYEQTSGRMYRKSGYGQGGVNSDWTLIDAPESGTTSTGNWVRFNDGTQICYANMITSSRAMTAWSSMYYADITLNRAFPKAFSSPPSITATVYNSPGAYVGMISRDASKIQVLSLVRPVATTSSYSVSYIAIGRWK